MHGDRPDERAVFELALNLVTAVGGSRLDPSARFFFGGFGNNWVDYRARQQFREVEALPGIEINHASGANYGRAQVELDLPPLRFRKVGTPSMYLRWASLSLVGKI